MEAFQTKSHLRPSIKQGNRELLLWCDDDSRTGGIQQGRGLYAMHIRCFLNIPSNSHHSHRSGDQCHTGFNQFHTRTDSTHLSPTSAPPPTSAWNSLILWCGTSLKNLLTFKTSLNYKGIDTLDQRGDKSWWANLSCLPWEDGPGVHFIGLLSFAMEIKHPGACSSWIGMHSGICFLHFAIHCLSFFPAL